MQGEEYILDISMKWFASKKKVLYLRNDKTSIVEMKQFASMLGMKRFLGLTAYQIVILAGLVVMLFFLSDSSVTKRIRYETQIRDLESQIEYYQKLTESDREKLHELRSNDEDLEKFARENYLMKKENEDVFIVE